MMSKKTITGKVFEECTYYTDEETANLFTTSTIENWEDHNEFTNDDLREITFYTLVDLFISEAYLTECKDDLECTITEDYYDLLDDMDIYDVI